MDIRVNTDNHITGGQEFSERIETIVRGKLDKFSSHITTLEVYFSDMNSNKSGADDKKCSIEVRLRGRDPMGASDKGATLEEALRAAIGKVDRLVRDSLDRRKAHGQ